MGWEMKVALITGGGGGIGRASALALEQAGFKVVICGRHIDGLEGTLGDLADGVGLQADVTDPASVRHLFASIEQRFGRLDLLFNNAGTGMAPAPIEVLDLDVWRSVIDTNLTGAFLCTQQAIRLMKSQNPRGGRIINNGSISAQVPRPLAVAYTVSKHGMSGLTRATSLEGRGHDIACGQIDIGNAATPLTEAMAHGVLQANGEIAPEPVVSVDLVARSVAHMAALPLGANVQFMTVMATEMPFIGRG